jgi:hypothetical protein
MANGHGGPRQGTPGRGYGNRTDLLMARKPASANLDATGRPITGQAAPQPGQQAPQITPDQTPTPTQPTMYPDEPVTAGLPIGPGAGPEGLASAPAPPNPTIDLLRALLAKTDNPDIRRLLARVNDLGA